MAKLFFLFALMPIIEIALLVNVGEVIGGWNTVAIVIVTAFVGAYLVRQQGTQTLFNAQQKMQRGDLPGQEMAEGLLLVIAGVLLVTPGFITDIIGFSLALPFTRPVLAKQLLALLGKRMAKQSSSGFYYHSEFRTGPGARPGSDADQQGEIIEGEVIDRDDDDPNRRLQ